MKKFFLMLVAALPLMFASCGDDNDDVIPVINLSDQQVTIDLGGSYDKLKCYNEAGKEVKATWTSDNEFIATIDSKTGKIQAKHVGETTVKAIYENATKTAKVIVKATDNSFMLPLLTFGASQQDIKNGMEKAPFLGKVEKQEGFEMENALSFQTITDIYPLYGYGFENDRLVSSSLTCISNDDGIALSKFLAQYYNDYVPQNGNDEITYFCNANNVDEASIIVRQSILESGEDYVIFVPAAGTKTRATGVFQDADFENALNVIKAQVKAVK